MTADVGRAGSVAAGGLVDRDSPPSPVKVLVNAFFKQPRELEACAVGPDHHRVVVIATHLQ